MLKYGVEFHELVYPKWGKIRLRINGKGQLIFIANPSLTPGKMPENLKPGVIPKGTRVFDYDSNKECLLSLSLGECMQIVDFAKTKNAADSVGIVHRYKGDIKSLQFSWGTNNNGEVTICNINYSKKTPLDENIKMYIPVPFTGLREIVSIINSYIQNYSVIKVYCLSYGDDSADTVKKSTGQSKKVYKTDDELPDLETEQDGCPFD